MSETGERHQYYWTQCSPQDLKGRVDNDMLFSSEISHQVYQIHKEGRVVNRFLTAQQHLEPLVRMKLSHGKTDSHFFSLVGM